MSIFPWVDTLEYAPSSQLYTECMSTFYAKLQNTHTHFQKAFPSWLDRHYFSFSASTGLHKRNYSNFYAFMRAVNLTGKFSPVNLTKIIYLVSSRNGKTL